MLENERGMADRREKRGAAETKALNACRDNYEENIEISWNNVSGGFLLVRSLFYFEKSR
jgi:hypothetical protein